MRYKIDWYDYSMKDWGTSYDHYFFLRSAKKYIYKNWLKFDGCTYWWKTKCRIIRIKDNRVMCEIIFKERK